MSASSLLVAPSAAATTTTAAAAACSPASPASLADYRDDHDDDHHHHDAVAVAAASRSSAAAAAAALPALPFFTTDDSVRVQYAAFKRAGRDIDRYLVLRVSPTSVTRLEALDVIVAADTSDAARAAAFEQLRATLTALNDVCYVLCELHFTLVDEATQTRGLRAKKLFVSVCPEQAPVRRKMTLSVGSKGLKAALLGDGCASHQLASLERVTRDDLVARCARR